MKCRNHAERQPRIAQARAASHFSDLRAENTRPLFESGLGLPPCRPPECPSQAPIPADYLFLNHISFLRKKKQEEFQEITGVTDEPHFDVRVVLDSEYEGALERVLSVEYVLHESYPEDHIRQIRGDRRDRFMLKEIANGEFLLLAKVTLRDRKRPLVLQRYISLTETDEDIWRAWLAEMIA